MTACAPTRNGHFIGHRRDMDKTAYELIVPVLVEVGLTDICDPLIEFLTVALAHPTTERHTSHHPGPCGNCGPCTKSGNN
jgi:hypothetical protein